MKILLKVISLFLLVFGSNSYAKNTNAIIAIASGGVHGQYYNTAYTFCNILNQSGNINCIARMTEGSVENIEIVLEDKTSMGISQEDILIMHKDKDNMRAVMRLYPEILFILASSNSNMLEFNDLINQENISIGTKLSGERQTARYVIEEQGINRENFQNIPRKDLLSTLCKNATDVTFLVNANPSNFIFDIMKKCNSRIISMKEEFIKKLVEGKNGYKNFIIEKNSYPNQIADISTISTDAILFVSKEMSEEIVYEFLKIIFSNQKSLHSYLPFLFDFTKQGVFQKTTIPHHIGVEKFLKEVEANRHSHKII